MGAWLIRAGRGGVYAENWLSDGIVGIGWDFDDDDIASMTPEEIRDAYITTHAGESRSKVSAAVSQVCKFAHDIAEGSTVVMYDPLLRLYHFGTVTGPCIVVSDTDGLTYSRTVRWDRTASRDALTPSSKNSLGSISTISAVSDDVLADLNRATRMQRPQTEEELVEDNPETDEEARFATYDDGIERIKDRVLALEWEDMELLVAGLLRALGYCARVTPKGPDGGRDVVASPDAPELESPRIVAEVKHRKGAMGASQIRSFIGGLRQTDRGLFVSTGGFTREARYEADRSNIPLRLLDLDGFVRLYVDTYDKTDETTRSLLPLVRIWWPA